MKHIIPFIALFILYANYLSAQGIAISDQTNPTVSAGAVLDVSSSTSSNAKGFLLPRISNETKTVPKASRSDGLLYYFTGTKSFGYYSPGNGWYSFVISGPYLGYDEDSSDPVVQNVMFTPLGGQAIKMTNSSGGDLTKGTVVQAGTTSGGFSAVEASTDHPIGVLAADCAAGADGWIVISGVAEVLLKNSTGSAAGDWIGVADTQGRAWSSTENGTNSELEIGHCIETKSSGTDVLAKVILHFN